MSSDNSGPIIKTQGPAFMEGLKPKPGTGTYF